MQGADLAIIKDIPGYKIIMKAVLKHQIQQLVEQLSETTGEESIILTASVSDGTLSHLGSESGKSFLDGHDEIKSQFLGFVLKSHHTKKTEKQFAAGPGRKSTTQQSLPLMYEDESEASYTEASYHTEPQQDVMLEPAVTPTRSVGKKKSKTAKAAPSPSDIKTRPKRSAAAMKSPLKFGIYVDDIEDIEELSDSEQKQSESTAATVTKSGPEQTPVKYTEIVPVSCPIPVVVVPKLEMEDSFGIQEYDEGSAEFSGAGGEISNLDNITVKKEAGSDIEVGAIMDHEEDPNWEPGTKKRRKSSGSSSVTSTVNVSGGQAQITIKKARLSSAEKQRRYRERRDSDPEKRQLYLQKLKARYQQALQAGKTRLVKDMSVAEHRRMKEIWKLSKQRERKMVKERTKKTFELETRGLRCQNRETDEKSKKAANQIESQHKMNLQSIKDINTEFVIKTEFS